MKNIDEIWDELDPYYMALQEEFNKQKVINYEGKVSSLKKGKYREKDQDKASDPTGQSKNSASNYNKGWLTKFDSESFFSNKVHDVLGGQNKLSKIEKELPDTKHEESDESLTLPEHLISLVLSVMSDD